MGCDEWRDRMGEFESDFNELPFPVSEFKSRLNKVQRSIRNRDLAGLLVTTPENIYYLTGHEAACYYSFQALVVPSDDRPGFVIREVDGPNIEVGSWIQHREEYSDTHSGDTSVETTAGIDSTKKLLDEMGLISGSVGYEADSWFLTAAQLSLLEQKSDIALVPTSGLVEAERIVKSEAEIEYIREAGDITTLATKAGIEAIESGRTQNELAAEIWYRLASEGGQHVGGQPLITSGMRTNLVHSPWKKRELRDGDPVYFEIPAAVNRYHACLLRTEFVGEPPPKAQEVLDIFGQALDRAIDVIEPGVAAEDVDSACRSVIAETEYGDLSPHRTGYGLGIAFPPGWGEGHLVSLGPKDDTVLEKNMVFHVPRVAFLPNIGAVGLSATLRVTHDGCEVIADLGREFQSEGN